MSKKLKPLTIFLSDDELVNFKSHFDEFLNMNCDDKIKEQQQEIERLNKELDKTRLSELHKEYIINELEKKLLELRLTDVDGKTIVYRLLDKLQELKGSDKE